MSVEKHDSYTHQTAASVRRSSGKLHDSASYRAFIGGRVSPAARLASAAKEHVGSRREEQMHSVDLHRPNRIGLGELQELRIWDCEHLGRRRHALRHASAQEARHEQHGRQLKDRPHELRRRGEAEGCLSATESSRLGRDNTQA